MDRDSTGFADARGTSIHEADVVSGPMAGTGKVVFRDGRFRIESGGGAVVRAAAAARRVGASGGGRQASASTS